MPYHEGSFLRGLAVGRMLSGYLLPQGGQKFVMHPASFLKGVFTGQALRRGVRSGGTLAALASRAPYHRESFLAGLSAGFMTAGALPLAGRIPLHHNSFLKGVVVGQRFRLWRNGGALPLVREYTPGSASAYERKSFLSGFAVGVTTRGVTLYEDVEDASGYLRSRYLLAADGSGNPVYDPESIQAVGERFLLKTLEDHYVGEDRTYIDEYRTSEIDQGSLAVLDFDLKRYSRILEFLLTG